MNTLVKIFCSAFFLNSFGNFGICQNICGFDSIQQYLLKSDSAAKAKLNQFHQYWKNNHPPTAKKLSNWSNVRTIPVVFHVIHNYGAENIPDSLIYQQLEILNESFRKIPGTPGDGDGVDTEIEFCMASIDPDGNPTTGITRTVSPCTDIASQGCGGTGWPGGIIYWGDSSKLYLNIWIRKNLGALKGMGNPGFMVIVRYDCIGRSGLLNGRIVVHEVGHWLGMPHTFNGGCGTSDCAHSGDYICDTPPVAYTYYGCSTINTCSNDTPDLADQVKNYMSYSLSCADMFTQGQKNKMYEEFLDEPLAYHYQMTTYDNLQKTGCGPCPVPPCRPIAFFDADKKLIKVGDSISFNDFSYNVPTTWKWYFPGGISNNDTIHNPTVRYDSIGIFSVQVIASNIAGSDTIEKINLIHVVAQPKWSGLGNGFTQFDGSEACPQVMKIYQDELYCGGYFEMVGEDTMRGIARWNGIEWNKVGDGFRDTAWHYWGDATISSMEVYLGELFVGGHFTNADTLNTKNIAKWDGTKWSNIGNYLDSDDVVYDMIVFNNELYVNIDDSILKWNGTTWSFVASVTSSVYLGVYGWIGKFAVFNNELYAGGYFDQLDGLPIEGIAKFDGISWSDVGSGLGCTPPPSAPIGFISEMAIYDSMLYISGWFTSVDGVNANFIARYDGQNWYPLGSGLEDSSSVFHPRAFALCEWDNQLLVGGRFTHAGGVPANYLAIWDGAIWYPMSTGSYYAPNDIIVWNNEPYFCGCFSLIGNDSVNSIAKWGCPNLKALFFQSEDTMDLSVSGAVVFGDQSINATSWFWDFGDGTTDTVPSPVHSYWQSGIYTVKLTVTNDTCSNFALSSVVILWNCFPMQNINFTQSKDTVDLALSSGDVFFYINPDANVDSLIWDFGDGSTDTSENPIYTYSDTGTFTVLLTGYFDTCSSSSASTVVVIKNCMGLQAGFFQSTDTVLNGNIVQFNDTSKNAVLRFWNFGDGSTDTVQNPVHTYDSAGVYKVLLVVVNNTGLCTDTAVSTVIVLPASILENFNKGFSITHRPNPATGEVVFTFTLPSTSHTTLKLYNILGGGVATVYDGTVEAGKEKRVRFDVSQLEQGIYFYRMITVEGNSIRKMAVVK